MAERKWLKPLARKELTHRRSFGQSISTSIDISPIIGSPISSDFDLNPFSESPRLTPEQSFNSSAYSTESQRIRGRYRAKKQREELQNIRNQSQKVQEFILDHLEKRNTKADISDLIGLDFYEQQLERMKDSLCSEAKDTTIRPDVSRQLLEMQREIQEMRETLSEKQSEIQRQEAESLELKQVVRTLEKTVLDMGGSVDVGSTQVQSVKPQPQQCACSIC